MPKTLVIGGSKGIGRSIVKNELNNGDVISISRTASGINHSNLEEYHLDIINDELPALDDVNKIAYCPGSITLKPISSLKLDHFRQDFEVNVLGAVKVIKAQHKTLKKYEDSSIVLFSTVAVTQGMPFHASIATAKAGVEGLVRSLAAEFAPHIRVNGIAPSVTNTPLASGLLRNEKSIENIKNRHPLKMILDPENVADMASFLLSEKSKGITGQIIGIDAGLSTLKI